MADLDIASDSPCPAVGASGSVVRRLEVAPMSHGRDACNAGEGGGLVRLEPTLLKPVRRGGAVSTGRT
jgi:hypothetical protein